jgi:pyridoxine 5'-phosphate synthase PdxJ
MHYQNVQTDGRDPEIVELNIGHAIVPALADRRHGASRGRR